MLLLAPCRRHAPLVLRLPAPRCSCRRRHATKTTWDAAIANAMRLVAPADSAASSAVVAASALKAAATSAAVGCRTLVASATGHSQSQSQSLPSLLSSWALASGILGSELGRLADHMSALLTTENTHLRKIARHYFTRTPGKFVRPIVVLLMAQAIAARRGQQQEPRAQASDIDAPLSPYTGLRFGTSSAASLGSRVTSCFSAGASFSFAPPASSLAAEEAGGVLPEQRRLAAIAELIHTASLMHDDVLDDSATRRGHETVNAAHGNKAAILAGDYLLSSVSVALARLRNFEVMELMGSSLADLVEGELAAATDNGATTGATIGAAAIDAYLHRTYLKTAALFAKSCRASAVLGSASESDATAAFHYGRHIGMAFQITDDVLDVTAATGVLGKPAHADMKLGLCTAPVLLAAQAYPEHVVPILARRFRDPGDVEMALFWISRSGSVMKARAIAAGHVEKAVLEIQGWPETKATLALRQIAESLATRTN